MTRYLLYSHDSYGLGHFRRSTLLAAGLVGVDPNSEVLIVTGSPRAQAFPLPERVDTVKLPSATKDDRGAYRPRKLAGSIDHLVRLRAGIVAAAYEAFEPDVVLVDHAPTGMCGELLPMLSQIESPSSRRPQLVLGLRDIIDDGPRVAREWDSSGMWAALARYDDIVVYGETSVLTTAEELGIERRVPSRVRHVGYVASAMPEPIEQDPYVLVTTGGGGDGQALLRHVFDAVEAGSMAGLRTIAVTGPLLSSSRRAELLLRAAQDPRLEVVEFTDQMRSLVSSATAVISMAGYNTVVEELAAGVPALLVPRRAPRLEQQVRASRMAAATHLKHCDLDDLSPRVIVDFVTQAQSQQRKPSPIDLGGVSCTANYLTRGRTICV